MRVNTYLKGYSGETAACEYLLKRKYDIIDRNFRCHYGEIDIIASFEGTIHFIEVKSWDTLESFDLSYVINRKKQKRISNASLYFLRNYKCNYSAIQYDVLLLKDKFREVEYYTNIYME